MTKPLGQLSQTDKPENPEIRETYWTPSEKESLKEQYGCEILVENGSLDEVSTSDAPSDAWIVTYENICVYVITWIATHMYVYVSMSKHGL